MPEELKRLQAQLGPTTPLITTSIDIRGRDWQVTAVQSQDALLDDTEDLAQFPYGLLLWESSIGLARYIAENADLAEGKLVLEVGVGVGLPGLVASVHGAAVTQTDFQQAALLLAQGNARQNGVLGVDQFLADWRSWNHDDLYDVLLGADILYERSLHFYLDHIFATNLAPGGLLLLSDPGRPQSLEFAARMEHSGWHIAIETVAVALGKADLVEVAVLKCRRG